jgi:hypothetical protein
MLTVVQLLWLRQCRSLPLRSFGLQAAAVASMCQWHAWQLLLALAALVSAAGHHILLEVVWHTLHLLQPLWQDYQSSLILPLSELQEAFVQGNCRLLALLPLSLLYCCGSLV